MMPGLPAAPNPAAASPPGPPVGAVPIEGMREVIAFLWSSLFPAVLQDADFTLIDVNPAFLALLGHPRERVVGRDPLEFQPADVRERAHAGREGLRASGTATGPEPVFADGRMVDARGRELRYRAMRRTLTGSDGRPFYLSVLQDVTAEHAAGERADRSLRELEDVRDLARAQVGALMDTAGLGLATFEASSGWQRLERPAATAGEPAPGNTLALQSIGSDIVVEASRPAFERLQEALRDQQRAEVRYAIEHPEVGRRWLLTRVAPATLASGKRTMSVVTLDITEQHETQQRTEQLLHELDTILESATSGIAYLRGNLLVRCNRRFEAMLGLPAGTAAGQALRAVFGGIETTERLLAEARQALAEGSIYETEFDAQTLPNQPRAEPRWYSLSVRRTDLAAGEPEAIAVLADVTRLKAQQRELETLVRDRELMFGLSGVGIAFLRDGRIQRANLALAQMTRSTVEELATLSVADLFADADDHARHWSQAQAALREHGRWTGERRLRAVDGRLLWVQVSKRLVVPGDPAGGIIASYVNVDSRHRAERAVALQADRTRSILDSVLVGIVTVGPQGIEWMNRSACRMFGGSLREFVNLPIATVAAADPAHPFLRTDDLTELVEGRAETFECRLLARDGREFWVAGNVVSTARESTGRQLTYALLDIQHRREAELRVSQAQAQLQRIIEAAPMAITLRDAATLKVLQVNGVAAVNGRHAAADLIGRTPEEIFDAETAALRRRHMREALAAPGVSQHEYRLMQDGELRVWDARYLPLSTRPGAPPDQLLFVATDVTEQRAAQEARLEAAIAQREMLVKEVHHRIKNNLQGVAGLLQQIAQRKPEVAEPIAEVVAQVQAIAQVYGLQVGASGPLQLVGVVEAITASVRRTFGRAIEFEVEGTDAAAWMLPEAESIPIALTFNELLTNAVKHSSAGDAAVRCVLAVGEGHVTVTIVNAGALPVGFSAAGIPGGVSGLGLVRALLPRRSASFSLEQRAAEVVAIVTLKPPGVQRAGGM
jgi:PAS domain S-box-containing protein